MSRILTGVIVMATASPVEAAEFTNLDFELASIPPGVPGEPHFVDGSLAVPGWEVMGDAVLYNNLTLGSPVVALTGPGYPQFMLPPLQGLYSPSLNYGTTSPFNTPFLSQVGVVPADALWMTFLGRGHNFRVLLGGEEISVFPIDGGRLAGDVSALAGREVELRFETYFVMNEVSGLAFDDITFTPTPEPSTAGLLLAGASLLLRGVRGRRSNA